MSKKKGELVPVDSGYFEVAKTLVPFFERPEVKASLKILGDARFAKQREPDKAEFLRRTGRGSAIGNA